MTKEDWIRKLTSRKFWAAICTLVTNLVLAFGVAQETTVQITGIIMAGATVIAYIVGEGLADAAGAQSVLYYAEEKPPEDEQ